VCSSDLNVQTSLGIKKINSVITSALLTSDSVRQRAHPWYQKDQQLFSLCRSLIILIHIMQTTISLYTYLNIDIIQHTFEHDFC